MSKQPESHTGGPQYWSSLEEVATHLQSLAGGERWTVRDVLRAAIECPLDDNSNPITPLAAAPAATTKFISHPIVLAGRSNRPARVAQWHPIALHRDQVWQLLACGAVVLSECADPEGAVDMDDVPFRFEELSPPATATLDMVGCSDHGLRALVAHVSGDGVQATPRSQPGTPEEDDTRPQKAVDRNADLIHAVLDAANMVQRPSFKNGSKDGDPSKAQAIARLVTTGTMTRSAFDKAWTAFNAKYRTG